MIFAGSRYLDGEQDFIPVAADQYNLVLWQAPIDVTGVTYIQYIVRTGDRFDLLANTYLGDPTKWWLIADMNPELGYPGELPTGYVLRIPQ